MGRKLKGLFLSRTFYTNVIMAVVGVAVEALSDAGLDPTIYAAIVAAVNTGLRWVTKTALQDKVA